MSKEPITHHQRLIHENTMRTAGQVLDLLADLTADRQQDLAGPIRDAIRQGFRAYANDLDTLSRQLHPLRHIAPTDSGSRQR